MLPTTRQLVAILERRLTGRERFPDHCRVWFFTSETLDCPALPRVHLDRMDLVLRGDLLKRSIPAKRLQRHLRLPPASLVDDHPKPQVNANFSGFEVVSKW